MPDGYSPLRRSTGLGLEIQMLLHKGLALIQWVLISALKMDKWCGGRSSNLQCDLLLHELHGSCEMARSGQRGLHTSPMPLEHSGIVTAFWNNVVTATVPVLCAWGSGGALCTSNSCPAGCRSPQRGKAAMPKLFQIKYYCISKHTHMYII